MSCMAGTILSQSLYSIRIDSSKLMSVEGELIDHEFGEGVMRITEIKLLIDIDCTFILFELHYK